MPMPPRQEPTAEALAGAAAPPTYRNLKPPPPSRAKPSVKPEVAAPAAVDGAGAAEAAPEVEVAPEAEAAAAVGTEGAAPAAEGDTAEMVEKALETSALKRLSVRAANPTGASDTLSLQIEDEAMGIIREVQVPQAATSTEAIASYCKGYRVVLPADEVLSLHEAMVTPPVSRPLGDDEAVAEVQGRWPAGVQGCRFVLRRSPVEGAASPDVALRGMLDKRGGSKGNAKNWKTRHFELSGEGLAYFKSAPASDKQRASPLGVWAVQSTLAFSVDARSDVPEVKRAKRPELCFCLKPVSTPLWPADPKQLAEEFDKCKFMCAGSEAERRLWIASIEMARRAGSTAGGDGAAAEAAAAAEATHIFSEDEGDDDAPRPAPADDGEGGAGPESPDRPRPVPRPRPPSVKEAPDRNSMAPEDFVPIQAKKVRGVGLGNIFVDLPKKAPKVDADEGATSEQPATADDQAGQAAWKMP